MALRIKRLLHEEGYTIAGAKGVLAEEAAVPARLRLQPELPLAGTPDLSGDHAKAHLKQLRGELRELLGLLERRPNLKPQLPTSDPLFRVERPTADED